jgi:hypothetical protein
MIGGLLIELMHAVWLAKKTRERQLRAEFMEAARRELPYTGEPLVRRTRGEADIPDAGNSAALQS